MKDSESLHIEMEPNAPRSNNKGGKMHIVYIILLLLLLGTAGYLYTLYNQSLDTIEAITQNINQVTEEKQVLFKQLDSLEAEIERYIGENAELDSALIEKQQEIEKIRVILRSQQADVRQIQNLRDQIAVLESTAKKLVDERNYFKYQRDSLETVAVFRQSKIDTMEVVNFQKTRQIEELSEKVEMGSQIRVSDMIINTYNRRGKVMTRAKRVQTFHITGTLLKNVLAESGKRTLYVRITAPNGVVLTESSQNQFNFEGKTIMFTERREVNYNNKDVEFEIYYNSEEDTLEVGAYSVVVFCDGKEVGKAVIELN
jgi:hypothetical protein